MTDLERHLREIGLLDKPVPVEQKPQRQLVVRDVSWFRRGEECPH